MLTQLLWIQILKELADMKEHLMSSQLDLSIPSMLYFLCLVGKNTTSGKFDCILMCWLSDGTDFSEQVGKHECI